MVLILGGRWFTDDRVPFVLADDEQQAEQWLKDNGFTKARVETDKRRIIPGLWTREGDSWARWARIYHIGHATNTTYMECGIEEV